MVIRKDFVTKPFERVEILSRIENMLEVRTLHNQIRQQNVLLEEKVAQRTQKLEEKASELLETRLEIIRRLGRAADYRDNETGTHIIRMSKYSELLGKACGMSDDEAELLLNASPMHDIGKIGTPDNILLKPGSLNASEWEVMKKHAEIGAEILSGHPSELIELASLIALSRHEKWDGTGYPHKLKGEAIPLVARIVALTDVFDALTSHRPYKDAWSVDAALNEINALSAKHFDPGLVPIFNEIIGDIVAIKDQCSDTNTFCRVYFELHANLSTLCPYEINVILVGKKGNAYVGNIGFDVFNQDNFIRVLEGGEITHRVKVVKRSPVACTLGGPDGCTLFSLTYQGSIQDVGKGKAASRVEIAHVDVPGSGSP